MFNRSPKYKWPELRYKALDFDKDKLNYYRGVLDELNRVYIDERIPSNTEAYIMLKFLQNCVFDLMIIYKNKCAKGFYDKERESLIQENLEARTGIKCDIPELIDFVFGKYYFELRVKPKRTLKGLNHGIYDLSMTQSKSKWEKLKDVMYNFYEEKLK